MYQVHDWSEVRRLDREVLSKRAITRRLAISRTTRSDRMRIPPRRTPIPRQAELKPAVAAVRLRFRRREARVDARAARGRALTHVVCDVAAPVTRQANDAVHGERRLGAPSASANPGISYPPAVRPARTRNIPTK